MNTRNIINMMFLKNSEMSHVEHMIEWDAWLAVTRSAHRALWHPKEQGK